MVQITSVKYKGVGWWEEGQALGVSGALKLVFRHNGYNCVPLEWLHGFQTML